jgi:competence protein ComEA
MPRASASSPLVCKGVRTNRDGCDNMSLTRVVLGAIAVAAAIGSVFLVFRAIDERSAPAIVIGDAVANRPLEVDVRGAVSTPGVYQLPAGARVQDAVSAAGGLSAKADLATINLARRLRDGEAIVIAGLPEPGATGGPTALAQNANGEGESPEAKVNINMASAKELDALPGIGEVLAGRIIQFRDEHGPFRSVDDLIHVDGISARTIDGLRDLVTTGP